MTMTGKTSVIPSLINPILPILNFSTNSYIADNNFSPLIPIYSYIVEGNSISLITLQTNSWVLIPFIIFVGVLLFSLLMFLNYKIYCKKVKNPKEF